MKPVVDLRRGECLRLLAGAGVGRVVYTDGALPAAHPVAHLLDGEEVVFRTGPATGLPAGTARHVVGFEADGFDAGTRTGWSVVGVGLAYEVTDPDRLATLAGRVPEPWADVPATHTIAVPLPRLTGRRLVPLGPQG